MKTAIILSAVSGLLSSASAQYFSLLSIHSASPIMYGEIAASGGSLWIGKKTSSYCPDSVKPNCPKGKHTNFAGGNGGLAMGTVVPGGQQVYIDRSTGEVHYTQAHSADTFGGITGGWTLEQQSEYGVLNHKGGLYACSTTGDEDEGPWQIYAKTKGVVLPEGCLSFWGLASNQTKPDAWQYA